KSLALPIGTPVSWMSFSTGDRTVALCDFSFLPNRMVKVRRWTIDDVNLNRGTSDGENITVFNSRTGYLIHERIRQGHQFPSLHGFQCPSVKKGSIQASQILYHDTRRIDIQPAMMAGD